MLFLLLVPPMVLDTSRSLVVQDNKTRSSSFPHFSNFWWPSQGLCASSLWTPGGDSPNYWPNDIQMPTMAPLLDPDCVQFVDLPFIAKALKYCGYLDSRPYTSSFCIKAFSMELVGGGEDKYNWTLWTPGKGWQTFEEQTWVVPGVLSGSHA
jgi:hypothetical protein